LVAKTSIRKRALAEVVLVDSQWLLAIHDLFLGGQAGILLIQTIAPTGILVLLPVINLCSGL
jgi:hypothetical protein